MQNVSPPHFFHRLASWFLNPDYQEDILGDLEEDFRELISERSLAKARWWYAVQVVLLFRPSMIRRLQVINSILKELNMFLNYLKIGWRNLFRQRASTATNLIGLSTGIAAFLLIALYVIDELKWDQHFEDVDQIYRVTVKNYNTSGDMSRHWANASAGHIPLLLEDYPEIEAGTRFQPYSYPDLIRGQQRFPAQQVVFADDDVFRVFSFDFLRGNPETAFEELYSLVISEDAAVRIFGNDWAEKEIIGESVKLTRDGQEASFFITGVIANMPDQQHFHFEYLAPMRFFEMIVPAGMMSNVTGNYNFLSYIKIPAADVRRVETRANAEFWDKHIGPLSSGAKASEAYDFVFQPITDIHLRSKLEGEMEAGGDFQQIVIFSIVGALILIIACINYINLATGQFTRRIKEIGVRKAIGAGNQSIRHQFLTESFLITVLSLPLALLWVGLTLPYLNQFVDKNLSLNPLKNTELSLLILGTLLLVSLLAGIYPAWSIARKQVVDSLRGQSRSAHSTWSFRSVLVTIQYAVVIGLIFSLFVIQQQMDFLMQSDPGYDKEQLIDISLNGGVNNMQTLKNELLSHPGIRSATFASRIPTGRLADSWGASHFQGDSLVPVSFRIPFITVDEDFLQTFDIKLVAGSDFRSDQDMFADSTGYYLINEKLANKLGYSDPNDAVGKTFSYGYFNNQQQDAGKISGVVKDFHFESMHSDITPMVMLKTNQMARRIVVKIDPRQTEQVLAHIETVWSIIQPQYSANYQFVDERYAQLYENEQRLSTIISIFTGIAVLIGCLGLIGLVRFIITTRIKEIGIRKVLGASPSLILWLISKRFLILLGISFVLIIPPSYYLVNRWLENFVFQDAITPMAFFLPLLAVILITALATSYQAIKASLINPANYLRDE